MDSCWAVLIETMLVETIGAETIKGEIINAMMIRSGIVKSEKVSSEGIFRPSTTYGMVQIFDRKFKFLNLLYLTISQGYKTEYKFLNFWVEICCNATKAGNLFSWEKVIISGSYEINQEKLVIWHGICNSKW